MGVEEKVDKLYLALLGDENLHIQGAIPALEDSVKTLCANAKAQAAESGGIERRLTLIERIQQSCPIKSLSAAIDDVRERTWKNRLLILAFGLAAGGAGGFVESLMN